MKTETKNPWKAIISYDDTGTIETDRYFLGRDKEAREIVGLVKYNSVVTLYGNSSVGKTSLLHAAVFPLLRQCGYKPVRRRLQSKEELEAFIEESGSVSDSSNVYVLDQFEEAFKADNELANRVLKHIAETCAYSDSARFVLSIRQDELYVLEEAIYCLNIESLRNNRYYLPEFDEVSAREVILGLGRGCFPPDIESQETIVNEIICYVKSICSDAINPLVLSLVCHELWEKAPDNKEITLALAKKILTSENVLEDYYKNAVKGLGRRGIIWLESKLVDKRGRRLQVPEEDIPAWIEWRKLLSGKNEKNPILSLSGKKVEFIHDRLANAAWEVKKSRGDENRPFIALWCLVSAVIFIWAMFEAWGILTSRKFVEYAIETARNVNVDGDWTILNPLVTPILAIVGTILIIFLPLLWAVGLERCRRTQVVLIALAAMSCVIGAWTDISQSDFISKYNNCKIIQYLTCAVGVGLLIYSLSGKPAKEVPEKQAKKRGSLISLLNKLWMYHPSFRLLLFTCLLAFGIFGRQQALLGFFSGCYVFIAAMLYLLVFPKISKKQLPAFIFFSILSLLISVTDQNIGFFPEKSLLNSVPILLSFLLSIGVFLYSICKWGRGYTAGMKIFFSVSAFLVLTSSYILSLGFNPLKNNFFDVYLYRGWPRCFQAVLVKQENGLYSINAAWTGTRLVPPIIREMGRSADVLNGNAHYIIECKEGQDLGFLQNSSKERGMMFYDKSKNELKINESLICFFCYEYWFKTRFTSIDLAYYEYLGKWLSSFTSYADTIPTVNLQRVNDTVLSYIKYRNSRGIQKDSLPDIGQDIRREYNYKYDDRFSYVLSQCQAICTAAMLDNKLTSKTCQNLGLSSLLCYGTVFPTHFPLWVDVSYKIDTSLAENANKQSINIRNLASGNRDALLDSVPGIWKNCKETSLGVISERINQRCLESLLRIDYEPVITQLTRLSDMTRLKNIKNVDPSYLNTLDSISKLTDEVSERLEESLKTVDQLKKEMYPALSRFLKLNLSPQYSIGGQRAGGLYWMTYEANAIKYILKSMLYDEIALSMLGCPDQNFNNYYFGSSNSKKFEVQKSLMGDLTLKEQESLMNFVKGVEEMKKEFEKQLNKSRQLMGRVKIIVGLSKKIELIIPRLKLALEKKDNTAVSKIIAEFREICEDYESEVNAAALLKN